MPLRYAYGPRYLDTSISAGAHALSLTERSATVRKHFAVTAQRDQLVLTERASAVLPAPENALTHGQAFTITGSGFGTRSDYNDDNYTWKGQQFLAWRFKDFEDQDQDSGGWEPPGSSPFSNSWIIRATQFGRYSKSYMLTKFYNGQRLGAYSTYFDREPPYLYVSFWFLMPATTAEKSSKFFRVYSDDGDFFTENEGDRIQLERTNWGGSDAFGGGADTIPQGSPTRIEFFLEQNSGDLQIYMDGELQHDEAGLAAGPAGFDGHSLDLGNLKSSIGGGTGGNSGTPEDADDNSFNYDEVVVDFTPARVELGDASTWAACTVREYQPQTAWSNTSITIVGNRGAHSSGTKYLYVVKADNTLVSSSGIEVVVT